MTATDSGAALQRVADRTAIVDLVSRLGRWLDESEEDPRAIFAEDVHVRTPGGEASGVDAAVAQARRNHETPTQHLLANVLVELDGDRATAGANALITFIPEDAPETAAPMGGRYAFEAVRTGDGWRLSRLEVRHVWGPRPRRAVPAGDARVP